MLQLVIWHLELVECLDGKNIEPCTAINESLGDEDVADGWRAEHWESTGSCRALELVRRAEGDGALGPPEWACGLESGEGHVHLTSKLLEDAVRGWGLSATQDVGDGARLLEAPSPLVLLVVIVPSWWW